MGGQDMVIAGLMVRCDDVRTKPDLIRRVVRVLSDEKAWILDEKASDPTLIPWVQGVLEKGGYETKFGVAYEGRPVAKDTVEPAKRILSRIRSLLITASPGRKRMDDTLALALGKLPADHAKYYDLEFLEK
jgi:hypothetical protein